MVEQVDLQIIADRIEKLAETKARHFVSENVFISGKPADIATAAHCFFVAAALRARSANTERGVL